MKYALAFLITATLLSSCSNSDNKSQVTTKSFKELDEKCRLGQNTAQCDELNNIVIQIAGTLTYSNDSPILHPNHLKGFDEESEQDWADSIQIMGTNAERLSYRQFENKQVLAEGKIDTSCVQKHSELDELNNQSLQSDDDEIVIRMATGHCHYVNNRAFFAPKITVKDDDQ